MIKDKKLRDALFQKFPELTDEEKKKIEAEHMEHYVLYKRIKKGVYECRCTCCGEEYTIGDDILWKDMGETSDAEIKHKSKGVCPKCKALITFLSEGQGKKYIWENKFFAVFRAIEGNLYISCFDVLKRFSEDNKRLVFSWIEDHRYCLTPDGAQHWRNGYELHYNHWMKWWSALKSENSRTDYIYVNEDVVSETFLKYAAEAADVAAFERYIKYLCMAATHPNIEYLMKTGFGYIIKAKLNNGDTRGVRINYRSNDVKKMLRLNKVEMELLKDKRCEVLRNYYDLRKADKKTKEEDRLRIAQSAGHYVLERYIHIVTTAKISVQKAVNYMEAQKQKGSSIYDWYDYIGQCQKLDYDVTDTGISMPKDLAKLHNRLTKIIQIKADKLKQEEFERNNKKREKFEYDSVDGVLKIILPKSMQEIIDEGKRLDHCVGGYADRHAEGKLTILFLRKANKPSVPYYTMEVNEKGEIVQCRGYKNNTVGNIKPQEIEDFEKEYQAYLNTLFKKTRRKSA